jgi:hypothetical protein
LYDQSIGFCCPYHHRQPDPELLMNTNYDARGHLERMGIAHDDLAHADVITISYTLHGWHVVPRTPAGPRPIKARAWLIAALHTGGRYVAPDTPGHPADLDDGGDHVDSVILMAIIQRHFLPVHQRAWEDAALAAQLGVDSSDLGRAQAALERASLMLRYPRPAPLGARWWEPAGRPPGRPVGQSPFPVRIDD